MAGPSVPGRAVDDDLSPDTAATEPTSIITPEADEPIMTLNAVEALFRGSQQHLFATNPEEDDEVALPDEEFSRRVEQLSPVLSTLRKLSASPSGSAELLAIAQKIGDGSRDVSWRLPLGQSGVLSFFIGIIGGQDVPQMITVHALRVIGNSCADTDENRARVVAANCMHRIVNLLNNDSIIAFVIPVLFNICVDYEPAQIAAYKAGINPELVTLISTPERLANANAFMNIICKLLGLVSRQEPEANFVHPATPFILLTLAATPDADLEDFLAQTSVALTYLSNQVFQDAFLKTPKAVSLLLEAFSKASVAFDISTGDPDEAAQLKNVKSIFTQALADVSANPLFASACPIGSGEAQTLQRWIANPYIELQSAACLALGNLARSDEACVAFVQSASIHRPLVAILSSPSNTDAQLLHSALSFLKNLAIPAPNKAILGEAGILEPHVLPRLWALDTQVQVQFTSVSLTRLLLVSSPENVKRMCAPLSADPSSPANERDYLHILISLFLRSDQEPTKTEAARAMAAVLRVLHSTPDASTLLPTPSPTTSRAASQASIEHSPTSSPNSVPQPASSSFTAPTALETFYDNHDTLPSALIYLGTQKKFPVLRSDVWFVMALMSRTPSGASIVASCLQNIELLRALLETVTGHDMLAGLEELDTIAAGSPDSQQLVAGARADSAEAGVPGMLPQGLEPQQVDPARKAGMERVDRENGLVLIAELLQRCPEKLRVLPLETFREILRTGGELVLNDRATTADGEGGGGAA
ncbi:uncharacterized protein JN550_008892 [Neoarthrinium moseri]|uniref:uncharacterized protein n=1 Tax=Neoarthrinium moseri TaxID=1658444 RepID=UPI001FDE1E3F|nr:uncharacterized protein JN550_008892 [Neoarthrinium moseri]KAI1864335.1 hypothetical protein JN550_008892 [Neoarthrinium moseri]